MLASLKQQTSSAAAPGPALDLSSPGSVAVTGSVTPDTGDLVEPGQVTRYCGERETSIPSLAPTLRSQTKPRDLRHQQARPDYFRHHMFDPAGSKVPRLCEGKNREFNNGMFGGGLPPPAMHYMGHHNQPVNLSRPVLEPELGDKARIPPVHFQQMQSMYKVGAHHDTATAPTPYSLHGPLPPHTKPADFFMAAARQEHLFQSKRGGAGQQVMVPLLPPATLEPESKCESCGNAANFMCSACKLVHYCSASCQKGHWSLHGRSCRKF